MSTTNIPTGTKIPVLFEVVRPLEDGEIWPKQSETSQEIRNLRQNKFVARPVGCTGPEILVCSDQYRTSNTVSQWSSHPDIWAEAIRWSAGEVDKLAKH